VIVPPLTDVDLKLLSVFVTVVRHGSFSLAQNALNVSQSTISIQMSSLEERVGAKLCIRGRGGFALTPQGTVVFESAKTLFAHLEDFRARIGGVKGLLVGEINVGVIDNLIEFPAFRIDQVIQSFKTVAKDVHVNITVAPPNALEQAVLEGQLHVAVSFFPRRLTQLVYEPAFSMRMELFCGAQHPLFPKDDKSVTPTDIVAYEHAQRGYVSLEQMANEHRKFRFRARSHSLEGLAYLVLSGRFLGFLSSIYAKRWVDQSLMRPLRSDKFSYTSDYHIAFKKNAVDTMAVKHMLRCLREQAKFAKSSGGGR